MNIDENNLYWYVVNTFANDNIMEPVQRSGAVKAQSLKDAVNKLLLDAVSAK